MFEKIKHFLEVCKNRGMIVYCKGHGSDWTHDKEQLKCSFRREGLETSILETIHNAYELTDFKHWQETHQQNSEGWPEESDFIRAGIKHNIEDAEQLLEHLLKLNK